MVTSGLQRIGQALIYGSAVVKYERSFAMHDPVGPYYLTAKSLRNGLMSQANTEDRNFRPKMADSLY